MAPLEKLQAWIYVSHSRLAVAEANNQVTDIVQISRIRNNQLNVTGALIFTGRRFGQLIEGPPASIASLKSSIISDPRHDKVTTIFAGARARRQFAGWSLVYSGGSRYMAKLLNDVALEQSGQSKEVENVIFRIFEEFASDSI